MAGAAGRASSFPAILEPGLEATENVVIDGMTYGNGTAGQPKSRSYQDAAVKVTRSLVTAGRW